MGLWHSADEDVTKCHIRGEVEGLRSKRLIIVLNGGRLSQKRSFCVPYKNCKQSRKQLNINRHGPVAQR